MTIDISAGTIIKTVLILLAVVFLYLLRDVLVIVFFAIMIAATVGPFATWMEKKRIPRLLSVAVLYVVLLGLLVTFVTLVIPILALEFRQLSQHLPHLFSYSFSY